MTGARATLGVGSSADADSRDSLAAQAGPADQELIALMCVVCVLGLGGEQGEAQSAVAPVPTVNLGVLAMRDDAIGAPQIPVAEAGDHGRRHERGSSQCRQV